MAVTTSQQIANYYQQFQDTDVTFTKEVIRTLMLNTRQVFIKSLGYQWPCIIYSSSMRSAKVITTMTQALRETLQKSKNTVSLRFSFVLRDKPDPLAFFVAAKVDGISPYGEPQKGLSFLNLAFTQRPPDDLIERLGNVLEANVASQRRREERIVITPESLKKLRLASKGAQVTVDNVPRKALLRDVSFGGAKVIMSGIPKFLQDKAATVALAFEDPAESVTIPGKIIRFEPVEGRTDIAAFAIQFEDSLTPMTYKMRISEYLRPIKKPAAKKPTDGSASN